VTPETAHPGGTGDGPRQRPDRYDGPDRYDVNDGPDGRGRDLGGVPDPTGGRDGDPGGFGDSDGSGAALEARIAERRAGEGDGRALLGELRRSLILVPYDEGGLWTARLGGVRWICGFTGETSLARFARTRDGAEAPGRTWEFAELRGARLLDEIVPAMGEPAGVALNIADPEGAMLFPPAAGIVPDAAAVGTPGDDAGARHTGTPEAARPGPAAGTGERY
jgi:hypothetical protein